MKLQSKHKKRAYFISWWHLIISVDVFLILITIANYYPPNFPLKWHIFYPFNLALEMNIAAWWSGICLFALGFIAYELSWNTKDGNEKSWFALSLLLVGLSFDEIASIHERIGNFQDLLPYGIICIILLTYSLFGLIKNNNSRKSALYILSGFIIFGTVALQEYLEHKIHWPYWMGGIRTGIEEGSELLGIFLLFLGIISQRQKIVFRSFRAMIPNPNLIKHLHVVLLIGVILSSIVSIIVIPNLNDLNFRGNPALWYPSVVNFILFSASFWAILNNKRDNLKILKTLTVLFFLSSVGVIFNLTHILTGFIEPIVPFKFVGILNIYVIYTWQFSFIVLFYFKKANYSSKKKLFLIVSHLLLLFLFVIVDDISKQTLIFGLFSFIFARTYLYEYLV